MALWCSRLARQPVTLEVDGQTQMDVARGMNISQAQVSRLEKGAICELRKYVSVQVS